MTDLRTIHIPADLGARITYPADTVFVDSPIHVVGTSENPDDFCMAFYANTFPGDAASLIENHRATLIAKAASRPDEESPTIVGDVFLTVDPMLADKIVEHDEERMRDRATVLAFREWMLSYSEVSGVDVGDVFSGVVDYAAHITHETHEAIRRDHAEHIAAMLGLNAEQVGVFFV